MKVIVKRVNKDIEIVDVDKQYCGDVAKSLIGNVYLESVNIDRGFKMYCDEEGLLKELPKNFSMAFNHPVHFIQDIVGDVVFVRYKPVNLYEEEIWDYEVIDVTEEDIELAKEIMIEEV